MDAAAWLETARLTHLAIESAGVFWIAAELAILFLVRWGREHLEEQPEQASLHLSTTGQWRAITYAFVVLCLGVFVLRRGVVRLPGAAEAVNFELEHLKLWSGFVTAWVLLEIIIVYHGWRGYRRLRVLLDKPSPPPLPAPTMVIGFLLLGLSGLASAQLIGVDSALLPYQNALYFYLRVAGIVWIAVEWGAAYILLRSYALLRAA